MKPAKKNSTTPKAAAKNKAAPALKSNKDPIPPKKTAAKKPTAPVPAPAQKKPSSKKAASTRPPVPPRTAPSEIKTTQAEIATRAYFIYESEGCPEGQEMQHWLEAEAQLTRR
jgi:hypothetical protein